MKSRVLYNLLPIFAVALFSYSAARAQVVKAVKDVAGKTKEVTVDTTKKTVEMTRGATEKVAGKTVEAAKTTQVAAKTAAGYTVKLVDNVKGQTNEGGRWLTVTTWDGAKWVSKRAWFPVKKAASATKNAVAASEDKQP